MHRAARIAACGHGDQIIVSSSTASLLGMEGLRNLGEPRLKDLSAPELIYQLGDTESPPLKSLYRSNLPVPATRQATSRACLPLAPSSICSSRAASRCT